MKESPCVETIKGEVQGRDRLWSVCKRGTRYQHKLEGIQPDVTGDWWRVSLEQKAIIKGYCKRGYNRGKEENNYGGGGN